MSTTSPSVPSASDPPAAGGAPRVLKGKYEVLESLAETDRCLVFRGKLLPEGQELAIKFLKERLSQDPVFLEKYSAELKTTANLPSHPHLVRYLELDTIARRFVAVMELFPHPSLEFLLRRAAPLGFPTVLAVLRQLASVLDLGYREGLPTRTIRLEDVLLSEASRECKLLRFSGPRQTPGSSSGRKPESPGPDLLFLGDALHRLFTGKAKSGDRQEAPEVTSQLLAEAMKVRYPELQASEIASVARLYVSLSSRDLSQRLQDFAAFGSALDELERASPAVQEVRRQVEQARLREEAQARFGSASDTVALLSGQPGKTEESDRTAVSELSRPLEVPRPSQDPLHEAEPFLSTFNLVIGCVALLLAGFVYWIFYR